MGSQSGCCIRKVTSADTLANATASECNAAANSVAADGPPVQRVDSAVYLGGLLGGYLWEMVALIPYW